MTLLTCWQRRAVLAIAASVVAAALTGCASSQSATGQPDTPAAAARSIATFAGDTVAVPVAGKPTAVYFFASGCGSCVPPLQALGEVAKAHPDMVYLPVTLSPYDDAATVGEFLSLAGDAGRAAAPDGQARLAQALGVNALGTLVVYNAAGAEVYRGVDPSKADIQAAFTKASSR